MSEQTKEPSSSPEPSESVEFYEKLQQVADHYSAPDTMLQELTSLAKGTPITLFVAGGMISGHIESSQDFLRAMAERYRDAFINGTVDGELPEHADELARRTFEAKADEQDEKLEAELRAFNEHGTLSARWLLERHLHLKDAFYTVPGAVSIQQAHIRVQLNQVVGWTLGVTAWR